MGGREVQDIRPLRKNSKSTSEISTDSILRAVLRFLLILILIFNEAV